MKRVTPLLAALLLSGGAAFAQDVTDAVIADLQAQGYGNIEIHRTDTRLRVEATRDGVTIEQVIDRQTGEVLTTETSSDTGAGAPSGDDNETAGDDNSSDDDQSSGEDDGPDHDQGDDDGADDDGPDHDSGDDHGDHSGGDDDHEGNDD